MPYVCNWLLTHEKEIEFTNPKNKPSPGVGVTHGICPPCAVQFKAQGYRLEREDTLHGT